MKNEQNFIFTTDKETADKLKTEGFICVEDKKNAWKFLNNLNSNFSNNKNIAYTDKLFI